MDVSKSSVQNVYLQSSVMMLVSLKNSCIAVASLVLFLLYLSFKMDLKEHNNTVYLKIQFLIT